MKLRAKPSMPRRMAGGSLWLLAVALVVFSMPARALDLDQYAGKVVLLDFWASWCSPCLRSFPWMSAMQEKYEDDGLVIIAVNVDADKDDARAFLARTPVDFQIHYDTNGELAREYDVKAMPTSLVIDRSGDIVARHRGFKVRNAADYEFTLVNYLTDDDESDAVGARQLANQKGLPDAN